MLHNQQAREQWLDRAWTLLLGDDATLATPRHIRREGLERATVRAAEQAALDAAAAQLADLRSGRKVRGRDGRLVDAIASGDVPMFDFIETAGIDADATAMDRIGAADRLLEAAVGEAAQRDVERALNMRRIALCAEEEILASYLRDDLTAIGIDAQWLQRWRQLAQDAGSAPLQRLWARLFVREVALPGRYGPAALEALGRVGERDVRGLAWLARYVFGEFIFDARGRYFTADLHGPWIDGAAALGLLRPVDIPQRLLLHHQPARTDGAGVAEPQRPLLLINHHRALQLSGFGPVGVPVPVLRLTPVGRQLFQLCGGEADMAYLLDLAAYLRERDVHVAVGEWDPVRRRFAKKFDCA